MRDFPSVDRVDMANFSIGKQTQFNPEFSQEGFLAMRQMEDQYHYSNYFKADKIVDFDSVDARDRDNIVIRILELIKLKGYRQETLHLSISILDRILAHTY